MSDETSEILAVQIKHRGQCQKPAGHVIDTVFGWVSFTFIATTFVWILIIVINDPLPELRKQAIQRGYATRDPITLEFKWLPK